MAPITNETQLVVYAIYRKRDQYVLIPWTHAAGDRGGVQGKTLARGATLDYVRSFIPRGLVCLGRNAGDDASIVEAWI